MRDIVIRLPVVLLINFFALLRFGLKLPFRALGSLLRADARRFVKLDLSGAMPFGPPQGPARWLSSERTFLDIRRDIKAMASDDSIAGVVFDPTELHTSSARRADLTELLDNVRESGKRVIARAELYEAAGYATATAASDILISPAGRLYTFAPRLEQFYLARAFERFGVSAQFIHIGRFKAAASMFVRGGSTAAERGMFDRIVSASAERVVRRVADRRNVDDDVARQLFDAPASRRLALRHKLLDGEAFDSDLEEWLSEESPAEVIEHRNYFTPQQRGPRLRPLRRKPQLAVVDLSGMIVSGGLSGRGPSIDPTSIIPVLRELERDDRVLGVLLYVNSPGGSAIAADEIWSAVDRLRASKPVVAYCDFAASGGYYIACAADRIVCRPESTVGSIGVVAGKVSVGGVLASVGVDTESFGRPGGEVVSFTAELEPATLERFHTDVREMYRRFLQRVGMARGIDKRRLHRFARGRLYPGVDAHARDLVDVLGGFDDAIAELESLCNPPRPAKLVPYTTRRPSMRSIALGQATQPNFDARAACALFEREPVLALYVGQVDAPQLGLEGALKAVGDWLPR